MFLASHNTMSYLKPLKWWLRPFHFIAKCQDKTIDEQYNLGIRMFDLRISYVNNKPCFAHGLIKFKNSTVEDVLDKINKWGNCYVRIILEECKYNKNIFINSKCFKSDVNKWIDKYPNIKFFEGTRKYDWYSLIVNRKFYSNPTYIQKVSSTTGSIFDDWWPRLYAIFNNKKNITKYKDKYGYMFIDFVGKYY